MEAGLQAALTDVPLRSGYLQALATWDQAGGPDLRLEAGAHLAQDLSAFAFGDWSPERGASAGAGLRWQFRL